MRLALLVAVGLLLAGCSSPAPTPVDDATVDDGQDPVEFVDPVEVHLEWTAQLTGWRGAGAHQQQALLAGNACYRITFPDDVTVFDGKATATWASLSPLTSRLILTVFTLDIHPLTDTIGGSPAVLDFRFDEPLAAGLRIGVDVADDPGAAVAQDVHVDLVLHMSQDVDLAAEPYGICPR